MANENGQSPGGPSEGRRRAQQRARELGNAPGKDPDVEREQRKEEWDFPSERLLASLNEIPDGQTSAKNASENEDGASEEAMYQPDNFALNVDKANRAQETVARYTYDLTEAKNLWKKVLREMQIAILESYLDEETPNPETIIVEVLADSNVPEERIAEWTLNLREFFFHSIRIFYLRDFLVEKME